MLPVQWMDSRSRQGRPRGPGKCHMGAQHAAAHPRYLLPKYVLGARCTLLRYGPTPAVYQEQRRQPIMQCATVTRTAAAVCARPRVQRSVRCTAAENGAAGTATAVKVRQHAGPRPPRTPHALAGRCRAASRC